MRIINRIKSILNDLQYKASVTGIMSDALEFGLEADVVETWLKSNYANHYGEKEGDYGRA